MKCAADAKLVQIASQPTSLSFRLGQPQSMSQEQQASKQDQGLAMMEKSADCELSQLQRQLHEIRTQLANSGAKAGGSARDDAVAKLDEVCKLLQCQEQPDDRDTTPIGNAEECFNDHCTAPVRGTEERLYHHRATPVRETKECLSSHYAAPVGDTEVRPGDHCAASVGDTKAQPNDNSTASVGDTRVHLGNHCAARVGETVPSSDAFTMTDYCIEGPLSTDNSVESVAVSTSSLRSVHTRVFPYVSSNRVKAVVVASSEVILPTPTILDSSPPPSVIMDSECPDVAYETVLSSADLKCSAGDDLSFTETDERNSESGASGSNEDHCYAAADAGTGSTVLPDVLDSEPVACALETITIRTAEKRPGETQRVLSKKRKMVPMDSPVHYIIMTDENGERVFSQRHVVQASGTASGVSDNSIGGLSVLEKGTSQPLPHQSMVTLLVKDDGAALHQSAATSASLESGSPGTQKIIVQMRVLPPRARASRVSKQGTNTTGCQTDRVIVRRPRKVPEPSPTQQPCTAIMKTLTTPVRRSQRRKKGVEDDVVQCVVFCCEVCGDCFSAAKHLHRHWQNRHREKREGKHRCSYCSYTSDRKCHVAMHQRTHTGERPFSCEVCKKGFYRADDVETHMRVHTKEKPFVCDECGQRFNVSSNLARHKKLHSDDAEAHACPECGKAFAQKVHLKAHLRVHTGDRPYSCTMCSKRFTELGSARKHEKMVHAGEYPHYCPHCGKGLANNFKLKKHLRARHYELTRAALAAAEAEQEG